MWATVIPSNNLIKFHLFSSGNGWLFFYLLTSKKMENKKQKTKNSSQCWTVRSRVNLLFWLAAHTCTLGNSLHTQICFQFNRRIKKGWIISFFRSTSSVVFGSMSVYSLHYKLCSVNTGQRRTCDLRCKELNFSLWMGKCPILILVFKNQEETLCIINDGIKWLTHDLVTLE